MDTLKVAQRGRKGKPHDIATRGVFSIVEVLKNFGRRIAARMPQRFILTNRLRK